MISQTFHSKLGELMDLEGWQDTRWGMTDEELVAAINSKDLVRTPREDYFEAYSELMLPYIKVGEFYFDVIFQMNPQTNRLARVVVRHDADPAFKPIKPFSSALQLLTERFGKPQRVGTSENFKWDCGRTTIALNITFIIQSMSIVSVSYQPTENYIHSDSRGAF